MRILSDLVMTLEPWYHRISGIGCASSTQLMMRLSPSCRMVGFFGKRGALPSGILHSRYRAVVRRHRVEVGRR